MIVLLMHNDNNWGSDATLRKQKQKTGEDDIAVPVFTRF